VGQIRELQSAASNGQKVQITVMDDSDKTQESVTDAEKLISQDHVTVLVDNTNVDTGWAAYAQQPRCPSSGSSPSSSEMYTNPDFFPEGPDAAVCEHRRGLCGQEGRGYESLALMYCAEQRCALRAWHRSRRQRRPWASRWSTTRRFTYDAPNYTAPMPGGQAGRADVLWIAQAGVRHAGGR